MKAKGKTKKRDWGQNLEPRMPQGIFDGHPLHRILDVFSMWPKEHGSMLSCHPDQSEFLKDPTCTKWNKKNISRQSAGLAILGSGIKIRICEVPNLFLIYLLRCLYHEPKFEALPLFCQISRCISCVTKSSQGNKAVTALVCVCV